MTPPNGIDFEQYRTQAKDLLKQARSGEPEALERFRTHHPEGASLFTKPKIQLADAQLVLARENRFKSWPIFKEQVLLSSAVRALDSGNASALDSLLETDPGIVKYRSNLREFGYFANATLLHHVAGNPIRCPLPDNIIELTKIILKHGADPNALCGVPGNLSTVIGLLLTGKQVSDAGVAVPLIDIVIAAGASSEKLDDPDVLSSPIWNGGRATAEELVRRGAKMDTRHAAALGRMDVLPELLESNPSLLEEALAYACAQNEIDIIRFLVARGAKGDVNVSPGGRCSALHDAAANGYEKIVRLLLENGANPSVIDNQFHGTPADWADHGGHPEIAAEIRRFRAS